MGINTGWSGLAISEADMGRDSFGNLLVSTPENLYESTLVYDKDDVTWVEKAVSGGTAAFEANKSHCRLSVTSTIGSRMVRQTRRYFPYQAAKGYLVFGTGNLCPNGIDPGLRVRFGLFDDHNDKTIDTGGDGIFVQHYQGDASWGIRSYTTGSQVDRLIPRLPDPNLADDAEGRYGWNYDKLDGNGPSRLTVDFTKSLIFAIFKVQWLGVGAIAVGVVRDGKKIPCHVFYNDNRVEGVYMRRASLPIRYEIENVSSVTGGSMIQICSAVQTVGKFDPRGKIWSFRPGTTGANVVGPPAIKGYSSAITLTSISTNNEVFLLALRLRPDRNRGTINPISASVLCTSGGNIIVRCYIGPAAMLAGAVTWTNRNTNSIVQYCTSLPATAGVELDLTKAFNQPSDRSFSDQQDSLLTTFQNTVLAAADIEGNPDVIVFTGQRSGNQTETVSLGAEWQEWV